MRELILSWDNFHNIMKKQVTIDKVRASRDGHEFHEAWVARNALRLLMPQDKSVGIAVEGLSPTDQKKASKKAVEIADVVLYFGNAATFNQSEKVKITQLKYSIADQDEEFRCSDAGKTIEKFAISYRENVKNHGLQKVQEKLSFDILTNRPIYPSLLEAIKGISEKKKLTGEAKTQAEQFTNTAKLNNKQLVDFASRFSVTGLAGSLSDIKQDTSKLMVDWSATTDAIARARLGGLRQTVRDKAGFAGTNKNVIHRVDVLAALEISDAEELLPCPKNLTDPGSIFPREQLQEALKIVSKLDKPLLVHADGGVGKTVFLRSLSDRLSKDNVVVFFDCFGGGSYRTPEDPRHLARRGLIHIINTLACQGLCDPILPNSSSPELLFSTFRKRLVQCVETISRFSPGSNLILFLDAIDNAALQARDRKEDSFPTQLLESLHIKGMIPGVKVIASCRSHRIKDSVKDTSYQDFKLKPFTLTETTKYLSDRKPDLTEVEIQVAHSRSDGNARILEHLLTSDRGLLDKTETSKKIELDDLIEKRIQSALEDALKRGYDNKEVNSFLGGLAVLPPPIPLKDYAEAQGLDISAIESFISDLSPLLEKTKYGIMFRDEPTETYVLEHYGSDKSTIKKIAKNLLNLQDKSVYAALALPDLLLRLDDAKQLFNLAFDERIPKEITGTVGKHHIRFSRVKAAVHLFTIKEDANKLVHLLLELAMISAIDQRGVDYILSNPDLVIAAQDVDASRRLFETKTNWPGKRHARLTIAHTLSGDFENANRHGVITDEWIVHHFSQKQKDDYNQKPRPVSLDIASIPILLIAQGKTKQALDSIRRWRQWYSYKVCAHIFERLPMEKYEQEILDLLSITDQDLGCITAALTFLEIDKSIKSKLVKKLAVACKKSEKIARDHDYQLNNKYKITGGLAFSAALATNLGHYTAANNIITLIPHERPKLYSLTNDNSPYPEEKIPFLIWTIIKAHRQKREIEFEDILPEELLPYASKLKGVKDPYDYKRKLKDLVTPETGPITIPPKKKSSLSYDQQRDAERFINSRMEPLLDICRAFSELLNAPIGKSDKEFKSLLGVWSKARTTVDSYSEKNFNRIFQILGVEMGIISLAIRSDISPGAVEEFLEILHKQPIVTTSKTIEVLNILAKRENMQALAGKEAIETEKLIHQETDVSTRASYYGDLSRAILPASIDEAKSFFKKGLEQMDAIGSGDNEFTNELFFFISAIKGKTELSNEDAHKLENICELNLPYEEEKFAWNYYGSAMSRVCGIKGLAKLSRWDDREKIALDYTLLPYLTALIEDKTIEPEEALILNRLADPVELWICGTGHFADAIAQNNYPNTETLFTELIDQYRKNNPASFNGDTSKKLVDYIRSIFGEKSPEFTKLNADYLFKEKLRKERTDYDKYEPLANKKVELPDITSIVNSALPVTAVSIQNALEKIDKLQSRYEMTQDFFERLRKKIQFADRGEYIGIIALHESIDLHTKLSELTKCKKAWLSSSSSLIETLKDAGISICSNNAEKFIEYSQLSIYELKKLSEMSGVPVVKLAMEVIKSLTSSEMGAPASAWLGLAYCLTEVADENECLSALRRLLNSNSTKLSENVTDGQWNEQLFPKGNNKKIIAGLIWRVLGAPDAKSRWNAAHSVRLAAKLGRWELIDELVSLFDSKSAGSFQAFELPFYYLHAQLWLLIALARVSLDEPKAVAKYSKLFLKILIEKKYPHPVLKHFSSKALTECIAKGDLQVSNNVEKQIKNVNVSPFPKAKRSGKAKRGFYEGRPDDAPKKVRNFYVDYDFEKYDVSNLADVFDLGNWEVTDMLSKVAYEIDPAVENMHNSGGRAKRSSSRGYGMVDEYHTYGEQLGWHSLQIVAGQLLMTRPVSEPAYTYRDEPWIDWLSRYLLTNEDGWWLSDGTDKTPPDVTISVLEKTKDGDGLTGDENKLKRIIGINDIKKLKNITIDGYWKSPEGVDIRVSSALVDPKQAQSLAKKLLSGDPFMAYIQTYDVGQDGEDYLRYDNDKGDYVPLVADPSIEARLDDQDPLGTSRALTRPRFSKQIQTDFSLTTDLPFANSWQRANSTVAHAESWKSNMSLHKNTEEGGSRLICSAKFLKDILVKEEKGLLVLIKLQRYKEGYGSHPSSFSNSTAVVLINEQLQVTYLKGAINKEKENKY